MTGVLRLAAYRRLLVAFTLNEVAWGFGSLALSYLVYRRTGSALGAAGFYVCSVFVPAFIAPAIVARFDRRPPRSVLAALYGGEALLYAVLALLTRHFTLVPVLAITLLDGVLALSARPLVRATAVTVTSAAGLLREGNALFNVCFSVTFLVAPGLGGAVVALGGISLALLVNVGLFCLIALVLMSSSQLPVPEDAPDQQARGRVRAAAAYVRGQRQTRLLLGLLAGGLVFFTISIPIEVVYAQHTLHAGAAGYGVLMAAWGGGAIVGSAIFARWHALPVRALIAFGAGTTGIGCAGLAAAPVLAVALPFSAIAGIGNGLVGVACRTAVQERTERQWMALVMSFYELVNQTVPGIGIVLGGVLAALADPRLAWAVAAAGSLAMTAATLWLLRAPARFREPATDPRL